jgi:integrase/recombinase XerD
MGGDTMKKIVDNFIDYLSTERNYSHNTLRGYGTDIQQYLDESSISDISELSKDSIRSFLRKIAESGLTVRTRNRKLASIRAFYKFLNEEDLMKDNPSVSIRSAKVDKKLPKVLSLQTVDRMLNSITNKRDKAIMETLYAIAIRVEELVTMRISQIDFRNRNIRIIGKGSKERIVPITSSAINTIVGHIESRNSESIYVFESPIDSSRHITTRAVYDIVKKYARLNGIDENDVSPHVFRHTCATHLHMNGVDIRQIQELLGHEDISTTTIYTHVALNQLSGSYHSAHPRG